MNFVQRKRNIPTTVECLDDLMNIQNSIDSKAASTRHRTRGVHTKKMACYKEGAEETPKTGYERPGCHICGQLSTGLVVKGLPTRASRTPPRGRICMPTFTSLPPCKVRMLHACSHKVAELTDLYVRD